jgi:hypothetical protein
VSTEAETNPDWAQGYGFQFWRSRHGYRGDGAYGQFCLVLPEHDVVLALTTESTATQELLELVWSLLLPAFDGATDAAADARLASRLAHVQLPTPSGAPHPDDPAAWRDTTFAVADADAEQPTSSLREMRLRPDDEGWVLVLGDEQGELACPIAAEGWAVAEPDGIPLGVAGGWSADGFTAEVAFLETPHTLRIACAPGGIATTSWVTEPLGSRDVRSLRRLG